MDLRGQRKLLRGLEKVPLVPGERDLIERLDRLAVARGWLACAATSVDPATGPHARATAERAVALLKKHAPQLEHGVREIADDRALLLERAKQPSWLVRAFRERPSPLVLVFSWTKEPAAEIARLELGETLGYPPCCIEFEEARRARLVIAEARGMVETWKARSTKSLLAGIDECRGFFVDEDPVEDAARVRRLRKFPFVSFVPCEECVRRGDSLASKDDARRRELAREVSLDLARAIERLRGGVA